MSTAATTREEERDGEWDELASTGHEAPSRSHTARASQLILSASSLIFICFGNKSTFSSFSVSIFLRAHGFRLLRAADEVGHQHSTSCEVRHAVPFPEPSGNLCGAGAFRDYATSKLQKDDFCLATNLTIGICVWILYHANSSTQFRHTEQFPLR